MSIFNRTNKVVKDLPDALVAQPENPVRYKTVLDYLVNLSETDYDKMVRISTIYRSADAEAAVVLGVANKPITGLNGDDHGKVSTAATDDEIDDALNEALDADELKLLPSASEPAEKEQAKEQSPSKETKIDVQG